MNRWKPENNLKPWTFSPNLFNWFFFISPFTFYFCLVVRLFSLFVDNFFLLATWRLQFFFSLVCLAERCYFHSLSIFLSFLFTHSLPRSRFHFKSECCPVVVLYHIRFPFFFCHKLKYHKRLKRFLCGKWTNINRSRLYSLAWAEI